MNASATAAATPKGDMLRYGDRRAKDENRFARNKNRLGPNKYFVGDEQIDGHIYWFRFIYL